MVPPAELEFLARALCEVFDLAEGGQVEDGRQFLLAGLQRAEMARDRGEPWGAELVEQWRLALEDYSGAFGARPDGQQTLHHPVEGQ